MRQAGLFVVGGTRSGKSALALKWAQSQGTHRLFLATLRITDQEMAARVARHRTERGTCWQLCEEPLALEEALSRSFAQSGVPDVLLMDCLSSWLANLMEAGLSATEILSRVRALGDFLQNAPCAVALVSLETGLGIVPVTSLGRLYRDLLGESNQILARLFPTVLFVSCGLPLVLKGVLPSELCLGSTD
ncbi:MAG: bifunctional adenosylcobinamide kinase/adenosylcobinamide-phosphate guanylyltransferase [Desulfovibrio sp.]|nr:bifunctional adenosylcobinamide kinase/adenosylcobinamide-phosphate guanylyltransferase [Desulfovibrio sp.]